MTDMDQFKTREKANEGEVVYLADPATGEKTEHWIRVLSQWSDSFQEAKAEAQREAYKRSLGLSDEEAVKIKNEQLTAALVADWSFEQPCTMDNVVAFLREAPQIQDQVDRVGSHDARFFSKPSGDSKGGPEKKSG